MTEFTRPATWDDLKTLARYLADADVEYALVGGYAVAAHGFNRFSEDIDILVEPSAENARRWIAALARLPDHAAAELAAEADVFAKDKRYAIRIPAEGPDGCGHHWCCHRAAPQALIQRTSRGHEVLRPRGTLARFSDESIHPAVSATPSRRRSGHHRQ